MAKLIQDELGDRLCDYCELSEAERGVHNWGGEPHFCIDTGCCERAYENYLEDEDEEEK
jgi:hypothetical protein